MSTQQSETSPIKHLFRNPILWLVLLSLACSSSSFLPTVEKAVVPTATSSSAALPQPPALNLDTPDGAAEVGQTFYRAYELQDFEGMYSLLSPRSQALVNKDVFVDRYQRALDAALAERVDAQPLSVVANGYNAEFGVRVIWETAVTGNIAREYDIPLVYEENRWGIVWNEAHVLPELADGRQLRLDVTAPSRANIYDINERALAFQAKIITIGVIPGQIQEEANLLNTIAPLLRQSPVEVQERYANAQPDWYVYLGDITEQQMQDSRGALNPYLGAGLVIDSRLARTYPEGNIAPHIIGNTGYIPEAQVPDYISRGYNPEAQVGIAGVEAWGEKYLRGQFGSELTVVNSSGVQVGTVATVRPQQARSVYTTIDRDFQAEIQKTLEDAIQFHPTADTGAIVVMDVKTGAIRALATFPNYDPSIYDTTRPDASSQLALVLNDPRQPLINRATQGQYPPGSIFKLVTFAAGVNSDKYVAESTYNSIGTWSRLGPTLIKKDWRDGGHGNIPMTQAIVVSCNSCFYDVAYELDAIDSFVFPNTARDFGFGSDLGVIGGIAESTGLIPDPEWKINVLSDGWSRGDAVNMGIGQGFVLTTPLQVANMFAAVANNGTMMQPTLIDRIGSASGAPEEKWPAAAVGQLPMTDSDLQKLQKALFDVGNDSWGTAAHRFRNFPMSIAGKTGTAEAPQENQLSYAWFGGYAPAAPFTNPKTGTTVSEPEIAIAVMMQNAGEGSVVAAPIFRRVLEIYYDIDEKADYPFNEWNATTQP